MKHRISIFFYLSLILMLACCGAKETTKNKHFTGKYPPLRSATYTEGKNSYEIEVISGQCIVFFSDNISQFQAKEIIEGHGGKIVEQMPAFNYYLVKVAVGKENDFIGQIRGRSDVDYSFFNTVSYLSSEIYILDNFKDLEESLLTTHGNAVRSIFSKYGRSNTIHSINRVIMNRATSKTKTGRYWEALKAMMPANNLCTELMKITETADANDVVLINMSFGVGLKRKDKKELYKDVSDSIRNNYNIGYVQELKYLAVCFDKMRGKGVSNFIVTKSSGNEGMYNLQNIIDELDGKDLQSLRKNMILANAHDTKTDVVYSNHVAAKHTLVTTIDISPEPWKGTSFASPKLLGFIDRIMSNYPMLNSQDMLQAVRNATPDNPRQPMTYEALEREAKRIAENKNKGKEYTFVLNMTLTYSGEWDLSEGKKEDIVKYKVQDTYSFDYLSGNKMALEIDNPTNYDLEIFLNVLDADTDVRPMRHFIEARQSASFYAYQMISLDIISIRKLEVNIKIW